MNTIKVYLTTSGRIAEIQKDFPLYQGQFQNKLLNIYVPTSILAPEFKTTLDNATTSEYVGGTAVKIGMQYLTNSGSTKTSKSYFMRYLKTLKYKEEEYALFERKLPKEFTTYYGQGSNAPTMIINVVNVDTDSKKILSIITSQSCSLDVMQSSDLDNDEALEATDLEEINASITSINQAIENKQDSYDEGLDTTSKYVVGAINEIKGRVDTNQSNIATNASNISDNANEIAYIKENMAYAENYIGQLKVSETLPSDSALNTYVKSITGKDVAYGDTVIVIQELDNDTDRIYKYQYMVSGWQSYEIQSLEVASNKNAGIVKGTYDNNSSYDTLVDIVGGELKTIYVKDSNGTYRDVKEYLNAIYAITQNIITGDTSVGYALKAVSDSLGNNIVDTYLTQTLGASKQWVRDYALPKTFNDLFYITSDGYSLECPTSTNAIASVSISGIGDYTLLTKSMIATTEYNLTCKNTCDNTFYVSSGINARVKFRLTTKARNVGSEYKVLSTTLSNWTDLVANEITAINIYSVFSELKTDVMKIQLGDYVSQQLDVIFEDVDSFTLRVYSNETYPSTFNYNVMAQIVYHTNGMLGELPYYEGGDYSIEDNLISYGGVKSYDQVEDKTLCRIKLPIKLSDYVENLRLYKLTLTDSTNESSKNLIFHNIYNLTDSPYLNQLEQYIYEDSEYKYFEFNVFIKLENEEYNAYVMEDDLSEYLKIDDLKSYLDKYIKFDVIKSYDVNASAWSELEDTEVFAYQTTIEVSDYEIGEFTAIGLVNDNVDYFSAYGPVIAKEEDSVITLYSVKQPQEDVKLKVKYTEMGLGTTNIIESHEIKWSDWQELSDSEPFYYKAVITANAKLFKNNEVGVLNDNPVLLAQYGLFVASVDGQEITIYSCALIKKTITINLLIKEVK